MSALSNIGMRVTPTRATIVMKKNLNKLAEEGEAPSSNHDYKTRAKAGEIDAGQIGIMADKDDKYSTMVDEYGEDVMVNEYGRPILDRELAYLPDPRYGNGGHSMFALLWYGGFLLAIAYIAWVFIVYEPEQTHSVMMTRGLNPKVNIGLEISCTGQTSSMVRVDYDPGNPCFNHTANVSQVIHSFTAPYPIDTPNKYAIDVPLCVSPEFTYNSNDGFPDIHGIAVKFHNITKDSLCVIDVFSRLAGAPATPIKRLSVEGNVVKTFFISYWRKREKETPWFLSRPPTYKTLLEKLIARFYELDAARTYVSPDSTSSSVVGIRFADIANDVVVYDMRSWVKAGGIFGTLWYMISAYACFWAAPILICCFPRDLIAEVKAGKLDGYTSNALADAWRPTVWLWIGGELIKRISHAAGP